MARPYRDTILTNKACYTADVIRMFVCNQDAGDLGWAKSQPLQPTNGFSQTETAVEHYSRSTNFYNYRISVRSATKRCKAHHFARNREFRSRLEIRVTRGLTQA